MQLMATTKQTTVTTDGNNDDYSKNATTRKVCCNMVRWMGGRSVGRSLGLTGDRHVGGPVDTSRSNEIARSVDKTIKVQRHSIATMTL
ncbi:unnamed protein product, partial [Ceratitis capitata]